MRSSVLLLAPFLALDVAHAAGVPAHHGTSLPDRNRYERCLTLTRRNPQDALKMANTWQMDDGGAAATHCSALALVALKRYSEAAGRLDRLGHENIGDPGERAAIFDQAGNAWLLAHRGGDAVVSFSSALALSPRDPDLLADRARAAALLGDWKAADVDLSAALKLDSSRADLLVLRASARHATGRKGEARADLEGALRIVPDYAEALLERGTLKLESGDVIGALADWQAVVSRAAGSAAAQTARARLTALRAQNSK